MSSGNVFLFIVGIGFLAAGTLGNVEPLRIIGEVWALMSVTDEVGRWWQRRRHDREALEEYRRYRK